MNALYLAGDVSLDDLITDAQADPSDDTAAMATILRRFEGAVLVVARSVTSDWHLQKDAAQAARLGLVRAVRAHTPGLQGFPSYAWRFMKGSALRCITTMESPDIVTDPQDVDWAESPIQGTQPDSTFQVQDVIWALKSEQQAVTLAYYVHDLRLDDIADRLGISKSAVSQRLRTIHRALQPVVQEALAA
jgi:RNA polymerase sigma factor (sigma-70 family)